jgi:RNAse (barnase) inhibitor barstar
VAVFDRKQPEDFDRLDWRILQAGAVSLYFRQETLKDAVDWFASRQYLVYNFDCSKWQSVEALHMDLQQTLHFPDYYGHNMDAFNDCLSDIEVPDIGGTVLVFRRFDLFAKGYRQAAQGILDIIESNSRRFLLTGQRLISLVQSDDPTIHFEPVGCSPVRWNPAEWFNKDRGL